MKNFFALIFCLIFVTCVWAKESGYRVYAEPQEESEVIDTIPFNQKYTKIQEAGDGEWLNISYVTQNKKRKEGWIQKDPFKQKRKAIAHPWSFGFGLGGYSSAGTSYFLISGELRYLWNSFTESLVGLGLGLGSDSPTVGYRVGQKFFYDDGQKFVPFLYLGFNQNDVTDMKTAAYEPGVGFQYKNSASSYFEVSLNYLVREPFDKARANVMYLNATSGFRF